MPAGFIDPPVWHAGLAGVVAVAGGLFTDSSGAVLLVKPNYRDFWVLPGGVCEFGEAPHEGCRREVAEELGLEVPPGRLLAVDWYPAGAQYGADARPGIYFVFDCGRLPADPGITLQREELDDYAFVPPAALADYLPPHILRRTAGALEALATGGTAYPPLQPA
jgi:8-oxo-dGTP diphosphatase